MAVHEVVRPGLHADLRVYVSLGGGVPTRACARGLWHFHTLHCDVIKFTCVTGDSSRLQAGMRARADLLLAGARTRTSLQHFQDVTPAVGAACMSKWTRRIEGDADVRHMRATHR